MIRQDRLTDVMRRIAENQERDFRWRCLRALLAPYLDGARDVLDAGCGSGHLAREALLRGARVTAVDLAPEMLDAARATCAGVAGSLTLRQLDLAHLDALQPRRFDRVLAIDVLEHVEDDAAALRHVAALLRSGGLAVVLVPAIPALYGPRDRTEGHYRRYSPRRLRAAMEGAGLRVTTLRFWNLTSLPIVLVFEKLMRRNIYDDGARYMGSSPLKRLANEALAATLHAERVLPVPIGLSLLAVGELPASDRREVAAPA